MTTTATAPQVFTRVATFERAKFDAKKREVEILFSSETPVYRRELGGYEILSHDPANADLSRFNVGAPVLLQHDPERFVGSIIPGTARIDPGRVGRARVRISQCEEGDRLISDLASDIARSVSIGYQLGRQVSRQDRDGAEHLTFAWAPYEASFVSLGADPKAGALRMATFTASSEPMKRSILLNPDPTGASGGGSVTVTGNTNARSFNHQDALATCQRWNKMDLYQRALSEGWDMPRFHEEFASSVRPQPVDTSIDSTRSLGTGNGGYAFSRRDLHGYNFLKLARELAETGKLSGLEAEASKEMERAMGPARGAWVPFGALAPKQRDMTVGSAAGGGNLVATDLLAGSFIELLRKKMLLTKMGATMMNGLVGNVAIPRQTTAATAYWVSENGAVTESTPQIDQVTMSPKTVSATLDISKLLAVQGTPDAQALALNDLRAVTALAIDLAGIHGTGTSSQPTGILATSGIGSVTLGTNGGAPTWVMIAQLEEAVAAADADTGSLGYLTNAKVRSKLLQTQKFPGTSSGDSVWQDGKDDMGSLRGYRAGVSNQVSSGLTKGTATSCSGLIYGDWSSLVIGTWGNGIDIVVDPYQFATTRIIRLTASMFVDLCIRHPASFSACLDIVTT